MLVLLSVFFFLTLYRNNRQSNNQPSTMEGEVGGLSAGRSRRSTAGNRMRELLEQERERLEAKKGNEEDEIFQEEEGDVDFEARVEEVEDIIDSDFDQSSDEGGGDDDDDELEGEKALVEEEKAAKKASRAKAVPIGMNRQPIAPKPPKPSISSTTATASIPSKRISFAAQIGSKDGEAKRSSKRKSTMDATLTVQARLKIEEKRRQEANDRAKPKKKKIRLSQADRIAEALEMEEQNRESLKRFLQMEEERRERDKRKGKKKMEGPWIRFRSVAENRNAHLRKKIVEVVEEGDDETTTKTLQSAVPGIITVDPVIAAREAAKKEREAQTEKEPLATKDDVAAEIVQPDTEPLNSQKEVAPEVPEIEVNVGDTSSAVHSRTTTATDAIMTEREEVSGVGGEDDSHVVNVENAMDAAGEGEVPSAPAAAVAEEEEQKIEKPVEEITVEVAPKYESRTYLSLHQLPQDTPWQEAYSHIFGSHINWSQYYVVPARNRPLRPRQSVCPITGLPALYKDPRSGIAYANKEAYRMLTRVMSGQYRWSGHPNEEEQDQNHQGGSKRATPTSSTPAPITNRTYEPMEMGCWLDDLEETGACNVLYKANNREDLLLPLTRPKNAIAPGDEQALVAAAKALPGGTTRSGGRRSAHAS